MEINFETKTIRSYREIVRQIKRTQLSMESVVPDVCDDIGRICSVQSSVLLKSKDLTMRGASVTGELSVVLLYINELENAVFDLHLTQNFSLDYDLADPDPEILTQIRLFVCNAEARALNPRKVSVTVELGGELSAYAQEERKVSVEVPVVEGCRIYTRSASAESALINAVCEKTFVVNEQFPFSGGRAVPQRLVSEKAAFRIADCQLVGSKVLMKGSVCVNVCYVSENSAYPVSTEFSAPFSQLTDIGQESMDNCAVRIEPTSAYFSLIDMISGEKALDAEIHAVAQIVSRSRQTINYVSDAYAAQYPYTLARESWAISGVAAPNKLLLESDERIELPEDCAEILSVLPNLGLCSLAQGRAEASVGIDVLYRCPGGSIACARRILALSAECPAQNAVLREAKFMKNVLHSESFLNEKIGVEFSYVEQNESEIQSVVAMTLDEEKPYDAAQFPSITAVRVDTESVWDLAKAYHSSCERIEALNETESPLCGKMLLIPKCI